MTTTTAPGAAPAGPGGHEPAGWPLRDDMALGPWPCSAEFAAGLAGTVARWWGLASLAAPAEMVAREFVGQAVRSCQGIGSCPPVRLRLMSNGTVLLVAVWDACPATPGQAADGLPRWGLDLVAAMSRRCGCQVTRDGKTVYSLLGSGSAAGREPAGGPSAELLAQVLRGLRAIDCRDGPLPQRQSLAEASR